jgi:hypothetical protein
MPNGANAERRDMPKGALRRICRTTLATRRPIAVVHRRLRAVSRLAPSGILAPSGMRAVLHSRRSAFRAVWHPRRSAFRAVWHPRRSASAPFGISRRLAFGAVWHFAPSGISRRLAFRAVWHFAPSGISRLLGAAQFGSAVPIKPLCYS